PAGREPGWGRAAQMAGPSRDARDHQASARAVAAAAWRWRLQPRCGRVERQDSDECPRRTTAAECWGGLFRADPDRDRWMDRGWLLRAGTARPLPWAPGSPPPPWPPSQR